MPPPVLLVHGCNGSYNAWVSSHSVHSPQGPTAFSSTIFGSVDLYSANGSALFRSDQVFLLDYSSNVNQIERLADALRNVLDYIKQERGAEHVVVVTHSMGALIARCYVQSQAITVSYMNDVAGLYMMAPPNAGCAWVNRLTTFGATIFVCPQAAQLRPSGAFMRRLNGSSLPRNMRYLIIAGRACWLPFLFGYHDGVIREIDTLPSGTAGRGLRFSGALVDARHYAGACIPICRTGTAILDEPQTKALVGAQFNSDFP